MKKINIKNIAAGAAGIGSIQVVKAASPETGEAIEEAAKAFDWSTFLQFLIVLLTAVAQFINSTTERIKARRISRLEGRN
jgi:hypothetical protein